MVSFSTYKIFDTFNTILQTLHTLNLTMIYSWMGKFHWLKRVLQFIYLSGFIHWVGAKMVSIQTVFFLSLKVRTYHHIKINQQCFTFYKYGNEVLSTRESFRLASNWNLAWHCLMPVPKEYLFVTGRFSKFRTALFKQCYDRNKTDSEG